MERYLRTFLLTAASMAGLTTFAQPLPPYTVTVAGQVAGCSPSSYVNVLTVQGTQPALDIDVPVDPTDCSFSVTLTLNSYMGWIQASTACLGAIQTLSGQYEYNAFEPDSNVVYFAFNCDNSVVDCNGVPNGPDMPGMPCLNPATGVAGTWSADCTCVPIEPTECNAGFFAMQAYQWVDSAANPNGGGGEIVPNEVWVWNLSSGTGDLQYLWSFGDGTSSTEAFPTHTYAGSGTYQLCLTISDNSGCTDTYCDAITMDNDGILGGFMGEGNRSSWTIRIMNALSTSVSDGPEMQIMATWPNPVLDQLNVQIDSRMNGVVAIAIVDLSGRVVNATSNSVVSGQSQLVVGMDQLPAGAYTLLVNNGNSVVKQRFVKVGH